MCQIRQSSQASVLCPQSKDGKTPLHMAAVHGRYSRSQAVIQNGACVISLSQMNMLSCFSAAHLLFSTAGADVNSQDVNGNSPLHVAARYGHELIINTLLANRADAAR